MAGKGEVPDAWFADAPMFIDPHLVDSLYNALLLPEYENETKRLDVSKIKTTSFQGGVSGELSTSGSVLSKLLSPIGVRGGANAEAGREDSETDGMGVVLRAVRSPESRLVNLVAYFAATFPEHVWSLDGLEDLTWFNDKAFTQKLPKPLLFIDLEPDTPIIPMAAELNDGQTILFYQRITKAVAEPDNTLPLEYPDRKDLDKVKRYWQWYKDHPESSRGAMHVIEDAIGSGGRPRWVDYRVALGNPMEAEDSLHLHIQARQQYDTGDFAYRFVHRGRRHGLRLVGSLQAGPALNILAIYEK
jgi:hypothetical protein